MLRHPAISLACSSRLLLVSCVIGCASTEPAELLACAEGEEAFEGRCVDPITRYEPAQPLDRDNVVAYGEPLTRLSLPPPPKSGFRLIAPPIVVQPGQEISTCVSWPYPTLNHNVVYAARLYTTPGLHHSNMIAKPVVPEHGPNPYPRCHPGADDPFGALPAVIPDVLFANSTQVEEGETLVFPPGTGFVVDTTREVSTSIHYLNTASEPATIEVVYDYFTMPAEKLVRQVSPFAMSVADFSIPPFATDVVGTTCHVFGGELVSLMPHTHKYAARFVTDLVRADGRTERLYEENGFDLESDITVYDDAIPLVDGDQMRFECTFRNTTDHDLRFGLGDNEMCILFGYVHPPEKQFVAFSETNGAPCRSIRIGAFR
ncbi:hypothetical protein [Chondromyces crocatus]|uniref:Copper type II ascorbate-dependent monooxygenase C-terminal domain-containing protein n=1 Tax=Chondromyces crocatus TaxID=52 RepID=A0A0K1EEB2_CHOCO|nr:hypothetical protein [Chondromyces crocatus]AKT39205.1 uncharacterized protein CMC5_033540 [Chondromyces crocatus]